MADPGNPGGGANSPMSNRQFLVGALGVILLLTVVDMFGGTANIKEASAEKAVPPPAKFASKLMGPTIKFLYW